MPSTNSRNLTLITIGSNVTIRVTYNAVFSPFERKLAELGLVFRERIRVIGEDPGTATDIVLHAFPSQNYPVTAGAGSLSVPRSREMTVSRASLQEDVGLGDADEIRARIEIQAIGLPPQVAPAAFTDQEVLLG